MKRIFKITFLAAALMLFIASCTKDLNTTPINPTLYTPANAYINAAGYKQVLANAMQAFLLPASRDPLENPISPGSTKGLENISVCTGITRNLPRMNQ